MEVIKRNLLNLDDLLRGGEELLRMPKLAFLLIYWRPVLLDVSYFNRFKVV